MTSLSAMNAPAGFFSRVIRQAGGLVLLAGAPALLVFPALAIFSFGAT
jgi:hypothetical protein